MSRTAVLVVAVAIATRLAVFGVAACCPQRYLEPDSRGYLAVANHPRAAFTESASPYFAIALDRVVGYPVFLAGIRAMRRSLLPVLLVQDAIGVLLVVFLLRQRRMLGERGALIAGGLLAIEPVSIVYGNQVLSETLFAVLVAAAVFVLVGAVRRPRVWVFALAGLLFGVAALTRPIGLYIPFVVIPVLFAALWRQRVVAIVMVVALAAAFLVPVAGWMTRVHVKTGAWVFSIVEGRNFLGYRAAGAVAVDERIPFREAQARVERDYRASSAASANPAADSAARRSYGIRLMLSHPVGTAISSARSVARVALGPGRDSFRRVASSSSDGRQLWLWPLIAATFALTISLWVAGAIGAWAFVKEGRWATAAVPVATIASLLVLSAGPEGYSRFRVAFMPLLCWLAGKGAATLLSRWRRTSPASA